MADKWGALMEVRAVYEGGEITFVDPVKLKHSRVDLLIVVPDSEVLDNREAEYQAIEAELQQFAKDNDMLRKLWSGFDGKYLDGSAEFGREAFVDALEMSGKY